MNQYVIKYCAIALASAWVAPAAAIDFAKDVQPIFQKHCIKCHGNRKQKSGFRLDIRVAAMKGGTESVAIIAGKSDASPLIKHVTAAQDSDMRMPPKGGGLNQVEIRVLRNWIDAGAVWPDALAGNDDRLAHWAWQPIATPDDQPIVKENLNTIDGFIRAKLGEKGLKLSREADRRTLIRRLKFDLHGLPPAPEDVESFVEDRDPQAYEKLVDRLLASPLYGERFAQHWLDIAHYADTHGFERDRRRPHAWPYRDYVIQAFNDDKPYDRFLQEQIAGDVLWPDNKQATIATGFLAAGPWDFVGQVETKSPILRRAARSLTLDDITTQVMAATVAMTVNCARCHDHKLDPITQKEYYRLLAVFAGVKRGERTINATNNSRLLAARVVLAKEINRISPAIDLADIVGGGEGLGSGVFKQGIDPRSGKVESRPMGYLGNFRPNQFVRSNNRFIDGVFIPKGNGGVTKVIVSTKGTTVTGITGADGKAWDAIRNGPVNQTHSTVLGGIDFTRDGKTLLGLHANAGITFDLAEVRKATGASELRFTSKVGYFGHLNNDAFANAWIFLDGKVVTQFEKLKRADGLKKVDLTLPTTSRFLTLISTDGGNSISMDQIGFGNPNLTSTRTLTREQRDLLDVLREKKSALDAKIAAMKTSKVFAMVSDKSVPEIRVLRRGDPESPTGEPVKPGAVAALAMLDPELGVHGSSEGSRRVALARWITDPKNSLMRRVIVNRLWHWHFGHGIVNTPSDFGFGGGRPSHPQLLDWLAERLVQHNWSVKAIHRLILTSATYKQGSHHVRGAKGDSIDADNRLLWRQNPRRIEAEAVRDAVLFVSGKLNTKRYGPGFEDFKYQEAYAPIYTYVTADEPAVWRRSIYRFVVRTTPDRFLTTLDCPDPANLTPKRLTTTTPLQSLALYNNDFMLRQARYFAQRVELEAGMNTNDQVRRAFALAFGRTPTGRELKLSSQFIKRQSLFSFCRSLLNANEFVYVD